MKRDKEKTIVLFRKDRDGEITAVFPTLPETWPAMTCYAHIGQHGGCVMAWYYNTKPAKPAEYRALAQELRQLGYNLDIRSRITRAMHDQRREGSR